MHRWYALFILPLTVMLASCAKEPLKQAGRQGEGILGSVRDLAKAYEQRDLEAFMDRIAPGFPGRDALRNDVENVFATYQNIRFTVQARKMLVAVEHKGNIKATFTWEGEWTTGGGRVVKDGARVTLVLDAESYKLLAVEGKNPFVPTVAPMPAREP
jgi:hypothetical protein